MLYENIKQEQNHGKLPLQKACLALNIARSGYLAWLGRKPSQSSETDAELVKLVHEIAGMPRYGYRRITRELHRRKVCANHKRVLRIMRREGLLCKRKKSFKPKTTDSTRGFRKYPNLVKNLAVTQINQVWVADITYVHLANGEVVYLADVMDRYSRKCLGWQVSRNIDAQLCVDALQMALNERKGTDLSGCIHHSDGGSQYGSKEYGALLEKHGIKGSMSEGSAYDNPHAESFFKTVKYEEVYANEYASFPDAKEDIKEFIEVVYNKKRLHSSIGYVPPDEFERKELKEVVA